MRYMLGFIVFLLLISVVSAYERLDLFDVMSSNRTIFVFMCILYNLFIIYYFYFLFFIFIFLFLFLFFYFYLYLYCIILILL